MSKLDRNNVVFVAAVDIFDKCSTRLLCDRDERFETIGPELLRAVRVAAATVDDA